MYLLVADANDATIEIVLCLQLEQRTSVICDVSCDPSPAPLLRARPPACMLSMQHGHVGLLEPGERLDSGLPISVGIELFHTAVQRPRPKRTAEPI